MNDAQQIFSVFYAIFWGAVFNVLARWKPFNFGLIFDKEVEHVKKRIGLSLFILTILLIIYFAIIFHILGLQNSICEAQKKDFFEVIPMGLSGIIPAFGIFGFYRLWMGFIEKKPMTYYKLRFLIPWRYRAMPDSDNEPEPIHEKLGILKPCTYTWRNNIIVGCSYIILAFFGTLKPVFIMIILIFLSFFLYFYNGR